MIPILNHYTELEQFEFAAGDQIWVMGTKPFPDQVALDKLPSGMSLLPMETIDEKIRVFELRERTN